MTKEIRFSGLFDGIVRKGAIANPKQTKVGGSRLGKFGVTVQLSDCKSLSNGC